MRRESKRQYIRQSQESAAQPAAGRLGWYSRPAKLTRAVFVLLLVLGLSFHTQVKETWGQAGEYSHPKRQRPTGERQPGGVSSDAWKKIKASIERDRYRIRQPEETQAYSAFNYAQDLHVIFTPEGFETYSRGDTPAWKWGLHLVGYGYGEVRLPVSEAKLEVAGNRIAYHRGDVEEWYINDRRGVEQGFTLAKPPAGRGENTPLQLYLRPVGGLNPELTSTAQAIHWKDEQGKTILHYSGLYAYDAQGTELESQMEVGEGGIRLRVNDDEAVYPITIDPLIEQVKLLSPDSAVGDNFGRGVAISGDTIIIGADEDDDNGDEAGAVYIFERHVGGMNNWGKVKKLLARDGEAGDEFGRNVAMSGDTVIVGAYQHDHINAGAGAAYIFERHAGGPNNWGEVKKLVASDGARSDEFGVGVGIDGDTIIVGASGNEGNLKRGTGAAYIFERHAGGVNNWGEVKKLFPVVGGAGDQFGESVGISEDRVVIGAPGNDVLGLDTGAAYIFERHAGGLDNWGEVRSIPPPSVALGGSFGDSVAISKHTVIIGAYNDDDNGTWSGSATIYQRDAEGVWRYVKKLLASDGAVSDSFGIAVAIHGTTALVGAFRDDVDGNQASGSAYIFERDAGGDNNWGEVKKLLAKDGQARDEFGISVAISDNTALVGAFEDDDSGYDAGSAYIFERHAGGWHNWGQFKKLLASDGAEGDKFGASTAISAKTLVVGARFDDDFGKDAGSAYIFELVEDEQWELVTKLRASDGDSSDGFGSSVSISENTIVVGAVGDEENGSAAGAAYIFERDAGGVENWGEVRKLLASDGQPGDRFGHGVAISGDTVLIGAYADTDNGDYSGSAYLFQRNVGGVNNWGEVRKLLASDAQAGDRFGRSVALSADTALIGAYGNDDQGADSGSAYIFQRDVGGANNWGEIRKLLASDGMAFDQFGISVALSGNTALVGADRDDDNGPNTGAAYLFDRDAGGPNNWGQVIKLLASDGAANDFFGTSVALSEHLAVVGAYADKDNGDFSGSAYVFHRHEGGRNHWGEVDKLLASDGSAHDRFGISVALSGNTALVGADHDDENGAYAGSAYVFQILSTPSMLDPFLCYKAQHRQGVTVDLSDQLDTGTYHGKQAKFFCNPADPNGEGLFDPDTYLKAYKVRGPHTRRTNVEVQNQFGTYYFDTKKTESLLVPSSMSLPPAPAPSLPDYDSQVDHYRCLKAQISGGTPAFPRRQSLTVEDELGQRQVRVIKPTKLCMATAVDGEGIKDPETHLMCYKVSAKPRTKIEDVQVRDRFGSGVFDLKGEAELCVPSEVFPAPR